jgi:hypothetical protein
MVTKWQPLFQTVRPILGAITDLVGHISLGDLRQYFHLLYPPLKLAAVPHAVRRALHALGAHLLGREAAARPTAYVTAGPVHIEGGHGVERLSAAGAKAVSEFHGV